MANPEHLEILKQGVEVWNAWRKEYSEIEPSLDNADLYKTDLIKADLRRADLRGADLSRANLNDALLCRAYIFDVNLYKANLVNADLNRAHLTDSNLHESNLSNANLSGAFLNDTNLNSARLIRANLSSAKLVSANLFRAILTDANLKDADLQAADMRDSNLARANLINTYLGGANFTGANLYKADFNAALLNGTIFGDNDLSVVKGLDRVRHHGPSIIGIDTLYVSGGSIPEGFLQGCGVPDEFITFLPSIIGAQQIIQFYSCFISYNHKDEGFAHRLFSRMRDAKLRVWYAAEDMKGGQKLHEQIYNAIQVHDKLLLVLSENSLQSEWVMTEIRKARRVEREENRRKLFPIRLVDFDAIQKWECFDADSGKDLAVELREYYIPDFSNWKDHDAFEKSFDRLLRDLKAEEK